MQKLTLFAMTQKGHAVLVVLIAHFPGIVGALISSRDSSIQKDYYTEMQDLCRQNGIPFYDRKESFSVSTKYAMAVSWRWILDVAPAQLIVFHDSLLPRYRGFNPLVTALINGDSEIGVTALLATQEYDRGEIIAQSALSISYPIRIQQTIDIITGNYEDVALRVADAIARDRHFDARPQEEANASYSIWRDEEDYFVDWAAPASYIKRFVDAVGYPYKGAAARLDGKIVRILDSDVPEDLCIENRTPGKVVRIDDLKPVVVCGHGLLRINDLIDDETGLPAIPLPRFRMRFK